MSSHCRRCLNRSVCGARCSFHRKRYAPQSLRRKSTRSGASVFCRAKCTTRRPVFSAASPDMPECSRPQEILDCTPRCCSIWAGWRTRSYTGLRQCPYSRRVDLLGMPARWAGTYGRSADHPPGIISRCARTGTPALPAHPSGSIPWPTCMWFFSPTGYIPHGAIMRSHAFDRVCTTPYAKRFQH